MASAVRFTVQLDALQPTVTKTADFTGANVRATNTARAVEIWLNVDNVSGASASLTIIVETTIDDTDIQFVQQASFSGITAANDFALTLNRADNQLGKRLRIRGVITGTTPSFDIQVRMIRME